MVLIIGHRGARNLWPENSLGIQAHARPSGSMPSEFDVHLARDGELVVIHDPSLERTTEGTEPSPIGRQQNLPRWAFPASGGSDVYAGTSIELHIEIRPMPSADPMKA
jgi:glycerophosphoryl diester phosphodiesterase